MTPLAEPFETPGLVALDSFRLLLALSGLFLAGYQVRMVLRSETSGQRARFVAFGLALLILAGSRLQNLGEPVTWQAIGMVAVVVLALYGTYQFARNETPSQPRRDAPPGRHGTSV